MTTIKTQMGSSARFLLQPMTRGTLFTVGLLFAMTTNSIAQAQSGLSNVIDNGGLTNFDNVGGGYGYGFPLNSGGSQQFFEGGLNRVYFLPEEKESESILQIDNLQIDKTVEAEGIRYEDLQQDVDRTESEDF